MLAAVVRAPLPWPRAHFGAEEAELRAVVLEVNNARATVSSNGSKKNQKALCLVATQIVTQAVAPEVSLADLARLAIGDPAFGVRVLALANSAAYGLANPVGDVRSACMMLGVRGVRNVALSLIISDMVPPGEDADLLLVTCLRRAVASRLIAGMLHDRALDDAFTAGLFLEIGALLRASDDLAGAANVARMPAAHRSVVERAFGFGDHSEAGAAFVASLRLPIAIVEAVRSHHDRAAPEAHLGKITWAAERVAGVWEGGDIAQLRVEATTALTTIGVTAADAEEVLARLPSVLNETANTFQRPTHEVDLEKLAVDANARLVEMNTGYELLVRRLETLLAEKAALGDELVVANEHLTRLAATDGLTGLANRRKFDEALTRDVSRAVRANTPLSLVLIDLDHFKQVNDTFGHQAGDLVLTKAAETLSRCLRAGDVAARYGGEELAAILVDADTEAASIVAERIRAALEALSIECSTGTVKVTASFGAATIRSGERPTPTDLIERADAAMYLAKDGGRNRVVVSR